MNKTLTSMIAVLLVFLQQPSWAETGGAQSAEKPSATAAQGPASDPSATTEAKRETEKAYEPIQGAFGITLGELFKPSLVAKVLDKQPQTYRWPEGVELEGSLIRVVPPQLDERFQRYAVKTTDKGAIYAIEAEYQFDLEQEKGDKAKQTTQRRKACKDAVKALTKEMAARYGKPRGMGWDAEWVAFRQFTENTDKSLRLYGNRCDSGIYKVIYTDQALIGIQAKPAKRPPKPAKEEQQESTQEKKKQQEQNKEPEQES
jgi:hypothetical protein